MDKTELECLREYLELKIDALEKLLEQKSELLELADERDRVSMNERLARMNEFREALRDQAASFLDRKEFDLRIKPIEDFVQETRTRIALTMWGIGIFFIIAQVVIRILWSK